MDMHGSFERKPPDPQSIDQIVLLDGVSWSQFLGIVRSLDSAGRHGPRLHYLDGTLELMGPSLPHEWIKSAISRCLEAWTDLLGLDFECAGSFLIKKRARRSAAQADECYYVGVATDRRPPDLAIEVIWTHGGLDKLEVHRRLGVTEVWIWDEGEIGVYLDDGEKWNRRTQSRLLPEIDVTLIERCIRAGSQSKAVRMLRKALKH